MEPHFNSPDVEIYKSPAIGQTGLMSRHRGEIAIFTNTRQPLRLGRR
jgi:hypothetical protein